MRHLVFLGRSSVCSCLPGKEIKLSFSGVVLLFCDLVDWSLPRSSVYGISQARALEWVAISFSRASSWPRDQKHISCISFTTVPSGSYYKYRGNPEKHEQVDLRKDRWHTDASQSSVLMSCSLWIRCAPCFPDLYICTFACTGPKISHKILPSPFSSKIKLLALSLYF